MDNFFFHSSMKDCVDVFSTVGASRAASRKVSSAHFSKRPKISTAIGRNMWPRSSVCCLYFLFLNFSFSATACPGVIELVDSVFFAQG
eukprot:m.130572 g.130572  ORF g.130572 m.130572 type:complete len:88 (+) comp38034_c1_seq4:196-459(+)